MNLMYNMNASRMQTPVQILGLLAASIGLSSDQEKFATRQLLAEGEVTKAKTGGLVIGGYTIGSAVSNDLFGHPAIRY